MARKQEVKSKAVKEPIICGCGCGAETKGGMWVAGHDMRHKSALLKAYDAGDAAAGAELVDRGWRSEAQLAARSDKGGDAESRKAQRISAKVERIDAKISALMDEREALLVTALTEATS